MANNKLFADLMKQAQGVQARMSKIQEESACKTVEASSGGGMITVTVNGRQELLSIKIENDVIKEGDAEMLQDLVLAAVNEGLRKSKEMMVEDMKGVTGGLQIPGLFP